MTHRHKTIGLGELLWDMLPGGRQLGGAPANFAYISTLLGNEGIVASRVGNDPLGAEAKSKLANLGVDATSIQLDAHHATGTVQVQVDVKGQPAFEIAADVAWDFLEWTPQWRELASHADAICFGSLAQRNEASRATIRQFLDSTREDAVRVFDVNLRQKFYTKDVLARSVEVADILKLNHEELPEVVQILGLGGGNDISCARTLLEAAGLKLVCVTRGDRGSLLLARDGIDEHTGYRIRIGDTVGAGDAFTAGLVHEYLRGASLREMNETANRVGAWVAGRVGAMPVPGEGGLPEELARI